MHLHTAGVSMMPRIAQNLNMAKKKNCRWKRLNSWRGVSDVPWKHFIRIYKPVDVTFGMTSSLQEEEEEGIYVYMYTHIHIHRNIYLHTHTHTQIQIQRGGLSENTSQVNSERLKMNKWWEGKCVSGSLVSQAPDGPCLMMCSGHLAQVFPSRHCNQTLSVPTTQQRQQKQDRQYLFANISLEFYTFLFKWMKHPYFIQISVTLIINLVWNKTCIKSLKTF